MATVQILTKNNSPTIGKTLDSIAHLPAAVVVGDLGSTDDTPAICKARGATVHNLKGVRRDDARNHLTATSDGPHFAIEPWESLVHGAAAVFEGKGHRTARIISGRTITHETRLWGGAAKFVNPVFERLDVADSRPSPVALYSVGGPDPADLLAGIEVWKAASPLAPAPYYYHACVLFGQGRYDEFLKVADHYLFMEKDEPLSKVMTRYYYAMTHVIHKRAYKPALQNVNLCLCARPLMAEFWCLTGDVYYHLLHRFEQAKEFYENAMILGARRPATDTGPMDLDKYRAYPTQMINSCEALAANKQHYASRR